MLLMCEGARPMCRVLVNNSFALGWHHHCALVMPSCALMRMLWHRNLVQQDESLGSGPVLSACWLQHDALWS